MFGSGNMALMKNEWKNDIIKTINSLEEPVLLIKGVSKTIKNKTEEQKVGLFRTLLSTLVIVY